MRSSREEIRGQQEGLELSDYGGQESQKGAGSEIREPTSGISEVKLRKNSCSRWESINCVPLATGVPALEVYTPKEIFVANGTQGKLTCKFKSANTTGTSTSVSWSFQPEGTDTTVSFFHYSQGQVYPGNYPPFKDRTSWAGDLDKKDASINIENMQFIHNGTYICDVKNPPDIVAQPGHIRLYVVEKEVLPVFPVWVVVGIVTAVVLGLTLLISMTLAVLYRRRNSKRDYIGAQSYMRS
ncbi:myelin protein zero-like protein 1 isoform X2 [Lontra canadensis]|uniref:myelin protein zero-like protein 1 isoform X2 n=1 Tax=Lontra canadensis TaxID=76717 RepID=UPI0013F38AAB|nr:myelin protein zero-like protein 1 isoform X2 [Lontra canadensis]